MTPRHCAIGVSYHIDEYLPGLDLAVPVQQAVTADLTGATVWDRLAGLYERVAETVAGAARRGDCPVVASGDCTTSIGTVAALQRAGTDAGIVWLDAHGDVQSLETTASGYLGGLPLRLLVGYRPELGARTALSGTRRFRRGRDGPRPARAPGHGPRRCCWDSVHLVPGPECRRACHASSRSRARRLNRLSPGQRTGSTPSGEGAPRLPPGVTARASRPRNAQDRDASQLCCHERGRGVAPMPARS